MVKKLSFFVLAGRAKLTNDTPRENEIEKIYISKYTFDQFDSDLAVVKLKRGLGLQNNSNLRSLQVPFPNQTYEIRSGTVAGYGCKSNEESKAIKSLSQQRIPRKPGLLLTYAFVSFLNDEDCEEAYNYVDRAIHICGRIQPDSRYQYRGLCKCDSGAPLVNDGKIIGIAKDNNEDCNDTETGSIYARVSHYKSFIDTILYEDPTNLDDSITVIYNKPHL